MNSHPCTTSVQSYTENTDIEKKTKTEVVVAVIFHRKRYPDPNVCHIS